MKDAKLTFDLELDDILDEAADRAKGLGDTEATFLINIVKLAIEVGHSKTMAKFAFPFAEWLTEESKSIVESARGRS